MNGTTKQSGMSKTRALVLLGVVGVLLRAAFWLVYEPIVFPDSPGYESLALQLRTLDFTGYNGARSPGFPLLLFAAGGSYRAVWLIQSLMGIGISLMLFQLAYRRTRSVRASFVMGLAYALTMNLLFFEASILSEALSTFLVVLSVWLVVQAQDAGPSGRLLYELGLGVVLGWAALTRPLLLFLLPVYLLYFLYQWRLTSARRADRVAGLAAVIIPAAVLIVGWGLFNRATVGYFGLTTNTGYNLTQHSGGFIERAPAEYGTIRDIYLRYREERLAESGWQTMTIWRAYPEMMRATGLSYGALSQKLTRMSVGLFVAHPLLYAQSVAKAWVSYWRAPIYWVPDRLHPAAVESILGVVWFGERLLLVGVNLLFLIIAAGYLYALAVGRRFDKALDLFLVLLVLAASVLQAMMEYGENGRYALPFQPLVMLVVFLWLWDRLQQRRGLM